MVLQAFDGEALGGASLWGFTTSATDEVTVTDQNGKAYKTLISPASVDPDPVTHAKRWIWATTLAATGASFTPWTFTATSVANPTIPAKIDDVLFGDVILCSGQVLVLSHAHCVHSLCPLTVLSVSSHCPHSTPAQSNMCFSTNQMTGASTEIALADEPRFQSIRLFTAKPTHDSQGPHADLSVLQNWSVATASTVGGGHANRSSRYKKCSVQFSSEL